MSTGVANLERAPVRPSGGLLLRMQRSEAWHSAGRVLALVRKELALEARRREFVGVVGLFSVLVLVVFTFALDLASDQAAAVAPGALWVAFAFAATLGFGRASALEREWGTLDTLLLSPVGLGEVYVARVLSSALALLAVEGCTLVAFTIFFNLPVLQWALLPMLLLGTLGLATAGTLFGAIAASTRARDLLLPVLLFPVIVPVLIACVRATSGIIAGEGPGIWLTLLVAFDAIFLMAGPWLFGAVLED